MEFSDVGDHCHYVLCRQQTFLPFECDSCHYKFCKHHFSMEQHECPNLQKETMMAKQLQHEKIKQNKQSGVNRATCRCQFKKCKKKQWINIECNHCAKSFCLAHRNPDDHKCDYIKATKPEQDKSAKLRRQRQAFLDSCSASQTCAKQNGNASKTKQQQHIMVQ
mmetsp:Transcript_47949/g.79529  ORF Transcript_47949/g.79529 Transcript_47949/m.79529 type:complete len:164 (-) Transcript_47949:91-582(-)